MGPGTTGFGPEPSVDRITGRHEQRPQGTPDQALGSVSRLAVRAVQLWDFDSLFVTANLFRYKIELLETQISLASLSAS